MNVKKWKIRLESVVEDLENDKKIKYEPIELEYTCVIGLMSSVHKNPDEALTAMELSAICDSLKQGYFKKNGDGNEQAVL